MKKTILILSVILGAILASCTIMLPQLRLTGVVLAGESERKTGFVTISVQPGEDSQGKGHKNITGFYVEFRNAGNDPAFIVWEKSALKYNNGAYSPFVQGQRYEDFSRPMNSTVIPPHSVIRKYIYSSQQVYREAGKSGNWQLRPIEAEQIVLVFCVQSRDITDYYTVVVH